MRHLDKALEAERAAGQCDLDATPSGKAMYDRVWARTQASIMNGDGRSDAGEIVSSGWKTILFAALGLAIVPAVILFTGERRGDGAPSERNAPPVAAAPQDIVPPSTSPIMAAVPAEVDTVSVDVLPTAPSPIAIPPSVHANRARVASPSSPLPTAAVPARARELTAPAPAIESDRLDLERRLLDRVRHALAARDYVSAGATLETYENTFDDGQLAEEEQALKIRWLAASGQHAAARDKAARFKERFPSSFFRPAVETAIRGMSQEGTDR